MSLIDRARTELAAINFGEEDSATMIEILTKFFDTWDSGGAVSVAAPVLQRLIAGKPLSPLTGAESEWIYHDFEHPCWQNIRCGTVFKNHPDCVPYDIQSGKRVPIKFPYWPDDATVRPPIFEVKDGPQSSETGSAPDRSSPADEKARDHTDWRPGD